MGTSEGDTAVRRPPTVARRSIRAKTRRDPHHAQLEGVNYDLSLVVIILWLAHQQLVVRRDRLYQVRRRP